jgi:branched-chain amino acid transport system permease protein
VDGQRLCPARLAPQGWQLSAGSIQYILIGLVIVGMLMWRPQGLLPERISTKASQSGQSGRNHSKGVTKR